MKSTSKLKNSWNNVASKYVELRESNTDPFEDLVNFQSILSMMGDLKGKKILDAGSGSGRFTAKIAGLGAECIGIDGSEELVKLSKNNYQHLDFFHQDLTKPLTFSDNTFDVILCKYVFMSIEDIRLPLNEFKRILKQGGLLVVSLGHPVLWLYHWLAAHWKIKERKGFSDLEGYFKTKEISIQIKESSNIEVSFIYRPISYYINTFIDQGFIIKKIDETKPTEAFLDLVPNSKNRYIPKALNCKLQLDNQTKL